jgi:Domain of unknown function (DUF4037)
MATTPMTHFIHGVQLNEMFYREAVAPILSAAFPELRYSAALIGHGSDVLGYDSERSTDHEWGPRLLIFLPAGDYRAQADSISEILSARLPPEFRGYSTSFAESDENRVRWMVPAESGHVRHHVYFLTVREFIGSYLGIDPHAPTIVDWLLMYQNALLEITGGAVYHDGLGELIPLRKSLAWYPREVRMFMLASQWTRIAQEEPFPSRCGETGDELGARINMARLVRDVMKLCFLIEGRYAPYSKWLGTAFSRLNCAHELEPLLRAAVAATTWQFREQHLCAAFEVAARMHNSMGLFATLDTGTMSFHERPYRVLGAERFAKAVSDEIRDESLRRIYSTVGPIGSIDQFADSTNLLMRSDLRNRLRVLFETAIPKSG